MRAVHAPLALAALLVLVGGCSHPLPSINGAPSAPPVREDAWHVPAGTVVRDPGIQKPTNVPAEMLARATSLGLYDVVDVALRNNPQTQVSWAQARSGAATYGAARAGYLP